MPILNPSRILLLIILPLLSIVSIQTRGVCQPVPFVKTWTPTAGTAVLANASITVASPDLEPEADHLRDLVREKGNHTAASRIAIQLSLGTVSIPESASRYRDRIRDQAFRLRITPEAIHIEGNTAVGVFYGIQTLGHFVQPDGSIPCGESLDYPDLPIRMIMVDPARQNENFDYYKRLIRFCASYKINAFLLHLTDDQTSCLSHESYPELMHPNAWTPEDIQELKRYANRYHIELTPEIESLGHSRMFLRRSDYSETLHKTREARPNTWMGTDVPGFTNVLCPASSKTWDYLDAMYDRAKQTFQPDVIHIGCDEVDMTACDRCEAKFGAISKSEWFLYHLRECQKRVEKQGTKMALWGDMLLKYPEIADQLSKENVIIYDWYYAPDVEPKSSKFFSDKGFEVIACPALVCAPHMVFPDIENYINIRKFTAIARDNDLLGVNTTIWIPTRYLSDVLWPGVAYTSVVSWNGSQMPDDRVLWDTVFGDLFQTRDADAFTSAWTPQLDTRWRRKEFNLGLWMDEDTLREAAGTGEHIGEAIREFRKTLGTALEQWQSLRDHVHRNHEAFDAIEHSLSIRILSMDRFLAAREIRTPAGWNRPVLEALDRRTAEALRWVEDDWNRNRYADDPNKEGLYQTTQHLLFRLKQVQRFQQELLANPTGDGHKEKP